jgi:hypothetical protein
LSEEKNKEDKFAVFAEAEGFDKPLILLDLTFGRLIDDIVVPFDKGDPFFIDGAPLEKSKIRRIKVLRVQEDFGHKIWELNRGLTKADHQTRKIYGEQYNTRFEHALRSSSEDVTSQVIKAYNQAIKPKIKDYLPKRKELINAAVRIFIEGMKSLGGS